MEMVDGILLEELDFTTTTHDRCTCRRDSRDDIMSVLRQVVDFLIVCNDEETAKSLSDTIGEIVRFEHEDKAPINFGCCSP